MADPPAAPGMMPATEYRRMQMVMPGIEGLYRSVRAICDAQLAHGASILIVGAGGGREIEALSSSPHAATLTGVDPSADMLDVARAYVGDGQVELVQGYIDDVPTDPAFDAATALLVMHFLPDDGAKLAFLSAVRARLRPGALYLHADAVLADRAQYDALAAAMRHYAPLVGLADIADAPPAAIGRMAFEAACPSIVGEERMREFFETAGFRIVAPFYRGLWYAGWWLAV